MLPFMRTFNQIETFLFFAIDVNKTKWCPVVFVEIVGLIPVEQIELVLANSGFFSETCVTKYLHLKNKILYHNLRLEKYLL